jgi:hypothetical protein
MQKQTNIMCRKKYLEKNSLDDRVIFVSSEGIKSLETAIENIEHIYKEMKKAATDHEEKIKKQIKK